MGKGVSDMQTKTCELCGETKSIEGFKACGKGSNGKSYRENVCKVCKEKYGREPSVRNYKCLSDPSLTYAIGCQLTYGQLRDTLEIGYLPPGSKWQLMDTANVYVVRGNEHWHDLMDCVRSPDKLYMKSVQEKQRLVKI